MTTVLCLHGLGRTPADWAGVRDGLAAAVGGGAVCAPQLPRERAAALATAAAQSSLAAAAGPLVLVGHSMGAVLALRLAASGAYDLRAVVLTNAFFPPARNGRTTLATAVDYAGHRVAFVRAAAARGRPTHLGRPDRPAAAGRTAQPARGAGRPAAPTGLGALAGLALRRDAWERLTAAVGVAVLVVHAPDDHHVPIDFARAAAAANGWPLHEIPEGGHHSHVRRPGAWCSAVVPWLRARGDPART